MGGTDANNGLVVVVVEKVCKLAGYYMPSLSRACSSLTQLPRDWLGRISALLTLCRLLSWCLPVQNAFAHHVFLHVHGLLAFHSCDASSLRDRFPGLVTPSPLIACVPESVRQALD
jgi:hypothetical protein